jgi:hypothetical protein
MFVVLITYGAPLFGSGVGGRPQVLCTVSSLILDAYVTLLVYMEEIHSY